MVNTVWVNAYHGCDFHPLADHMTKLKNFTKEKILIFLQLMLEQPEFFKAFHTGNLPMRKPSMPV